MPLPPALAARLSKRGLIKQQAQRTAEEPEEEVFAEDYDDFTTQAVTALNMRLTPCPLCPNKWNIHHDCTQFCWMHWVDAVRPDPTFERRRKNMLKKYPVPEGWKEQLDPGTGRYYYYEESTGKVSWMSPAYPKAVITEPAAVLRERMKAQPITKAPVLYKPGEEPEEEKEVVYEPIEKDPAATRAAIIGKLYARGRKKQKTADLDPMDPAAYSDVPRGGWSDGLETQADAKTGVDVTASGPLFQQRPYPAPGAVLRANAERNKKR